MKWKNLLNDALFALSYTEVTIGEFFRVLTLHHAGIDFFA